MIRTNSQHAIGVVAMPSGTVAKNHAEALSHFNVALLIDGGQLRSKALPHSGHTPEAVDMDVPERS